LDHSAEYAEGHAVNHAEGHSEGHNTDHAEDHNEDRNTYNTERHTEDHNEGSSERLGGSPFMHVHDVVELQVDDVVAYSGRVAMVIRIGFDRYAGTVRIVERNDDPTSWSAGAWVPACACSYLTTIEGYFNTLPP
jgi:hypothetical protein